MKLNDLKEKRARDFDAMKAIHEKATAEKRDMSAEERAAFSDLEGKVQAHDAGIADLMKIADLERMAPGESVRDERSRDMRSYSLAKAIRESNGDRLTGVEAEMHDDLSRGRSEVRGVMVPTEILLGGMETRVLKTTTPGAGPGSNLIATDLASMTDRRRASLMVEAMGATILRNLTGNLDLPRLNASGTAHWISEHTDTTRSDPNFKKASMGPKTVSAEYEVSRRMLLQSNEALETILRNDLGYLLAQGLDRAAIRGGGANEPTGVLGTAGIGTVTGGPLDSDITADMIAALEADDVTGTAAFLTNPAVMKVARKTKDGDGHVIPMSEIFHGERVETSTQVPGDIGTGSDKNALIYGEWASLYIGYWSGVDLLMNPYHADVASKGGALLHAFLDADVVVRHPEGFVTAEID